LQQYPPQVSVINFPIFGKLKKVAAIFAISVYLFGATDAYQFLKLPLFITHYVKHIAEDPNTTLSSFIKMHYAGEIVFDEDYQQDMQLPFKTQEKDVCCSSSFTVTLQEQKFTVEPITLSLNKQIHPQLPQSDYSLLSVIDIFQPPRLV
jgi:hypothetical protein